MCFHMCLQIILLCEALAAAREGAHVRPFASVGAHMRAQIEVEREALATAFKGTKVRSLPSVSERVPLEFR